MGSNQIKAIGKGKVFAQVGTRELVFEGRLKQMEDGSVFVDDARTGKLVELSRDAAKEIIWTERQEPAAEAPQQKTEGV